MQIPKPNHQRRAPKKTKRSQFSKKVRKQIFERDEGSCRQCGGPGQEIHHIVYRSRSGRGVYSNGLTLCHDCHREIHENTDLSDKWINIFRDWYGYGFWKDEFDG